VADKGGPLAEDYYGFIAGSAYLVAALATVVPCSMRCGAAMQVWWSVVGCVIVGYRVLSCVRVLQWVFM
jgi:hypothetical protein